MSSNVYKRNQSDRQRNFNDFFEELGLGEMRFEHYETLESSDPDYSSGLSQENVHKLTEDLLNPLPPEEHQ